MNNRTITPHHQEVAARLKNIYGRKKKELGLTQIKLAELLDMRQSSVSQYLNGIIATNMEIVIKFANLLQVPPEEIDPELLSITKITKPSNSPLTVRYSLMGSAPSTNEFSPSFINVENSDGYAVEINTTSYEPFIAMGTMAVVDPMLAVEKNDMVFIRFTNGTRIIARVLEIDEDSTTIRPLNTPDEYIVVTNEELDIIDLIVGYEPPTRHKRR